MKEIHHIYIFHCQFKRLKCKPRVPKCVCTACVSVGAQCCIELRIYAEAIQWCDEGLKAYPVDKKLLELRTAADKHKVDILLNVFCCYLRSVVPITCNPSPFFCTQESCRERCQEGQTQRKEVTRKGRGT